jgi:hypothetical protein
MRVQYRQRSDRRRRNFSNDFRRLVAWIDNQSLTSLRIADQPDILGIQPRNNCSLSFLYHFFIKFLITTIFDILYTHCPPAHPSVNHSGYFRFPQRSFVQFKQFITIGTR